LESRTRKKKDMDKAKSVMFREYMKGKTAVAHDGSEKGGKEVKKNHRARAGKGGGRKKKKSKEKETRAGIARKDIAT